MTNGVLKKRHYEKSLASNQKVIVGIWGTYAYKRRLGENNTHRVHQRQEKI